VKLTEAALNSQLYKKPNLIGRAAGKTGLSFCSVYRKVYLEDCHMERRSKGVQSKYVREKSIVEERKKLILKKY
jgi:hypothetical protein